MPNNVIRKATNRWTKGLVMDFSPENTKNEVLTHALNATLLTFNGNEMSLQNDMGNARVETAYLPEGYMPVGTCEYGGIIYIVSYNPLEDKSQIGCFPSPERNIASDEIGIPQVHISREDFQEIYDDVDKIPTGVLKHNTQYVLLKNDNLNPGDKFLICSNPDIYNEKLENLLVKKDPKCNSKAAKDKDGYELVPNPILALNVVSIEESGKIVYLNSDIRRYDVPNIYDITNEVNGESNTEQYKDVYKYHILGTGGNVNGEFNQQAVDIDSYRNALSSGYSVFKSKTSGKLAILAELIMIDSYSVTHSLKPCVDEQGTTIDGKFDIILHHEVEPIITNENYNIAPKLKYYYLQKSQGYIQYYDLDNPNTPINTKTLFEEKEDGSITQNINNAFLSTKLSSIYEEVEEVESVDLNQTLQQKCQFNFPYTNTYHGNLTPYNKENLNDKSICTKFTENKYHRFNKNQIQDNIEYFQNNFKFYKFVDNDLNYIQISDIKNYVDNDQLFIVAPIDTYLTYDQFKPNVDDNYIDGLNEKDNKYAEDDPLYLFTLSNFIPTVPESDNYTPYPDLKLGTIQLPSLVYQYGIDLPFKYDYTIVPCMTYGRLDHLAVSNTVDFSKLHAFNRSGFTTWKYRIDDGYLRLTVGAEIFDTYETHKVDGLIFEFYDHRGFAGSLEFVDKKSYNGVFTKVIPLNSLQALSRKKISNDSQLTDYKHNINIIEEYKDNNYTGSYYLNNENVSYTDHQVGWNIKDSDNDCGTIYSNVIYGIKAYLRRTTEQGIEYIRKPDMFVYTLPIFNEYYYKIDNFMSISNPQLQFMLTYKLIDESTKVPYNSDDNAIKQGYNSNDKKQIDEYISGFYNISQNSKLDLIKYYKYSGTTNLYLEVGLKQDYNNVNLAYNPELNKYFTCNLKLISDNDKDSTYNVVSESSELTDPIKILNYYQNNLNLNINKLVFAYTDGVGSPIESSDLSIKDGELLSRNFIHNQGNNPIKIKYDFIVGYTINISNIRTTNIPATTVCALFHKTSDGEYNYKDFGIYKQDDGQGGYQYLSDAIFYNGGTSDQEEFGLCKQIKTNGANMLEECHIFATEITDAVERFNYGELNSGNPLKKMVPYIGKLAFCQPHAHGMSFKNGVNIHETKLANDEYLYGIPPGTEVKYATHGEDNDYEYGYGIVPRDFLHYKPKYNLCLNTKNAISLQSEFISTLHSNIIHGRVLGINMKNTHEQNWNENMPMREYTGFTGTQIALFNKKLLNTMSKIYAYNPDYDSLQINVGDVDLQKYSPKFTSNLISLNSEFKLEQNTLNDYLYISNINLTKYLEDLNFYSSDLSEDKIIIKNDIHFIDHLQFTADYTYCGTNVAPYLINQFTYNTVVPVEIEEELTFNKSNLVVVKHTDNTNSFISGNLNKNLLYGYNPEYNKLITLDVSNYQIDIDGNLIMDSSGTKKEKDLNCIITANISKSLYPPSGAYSYDITPDWGDGLSETINVTLSLNKTGVQNLVKFVENTVENTGEFFITSVAPQDAMTNFIRFTLSPSIQIKNNKNYYYDIYMDSITLQCAIKSLNQDILTRNKISLSQQSEETLKQLIFGSQTDDVTYKTSLGPVTLQNKQVWAYPNSDNEIRIEPLYNVLTGDWYDSNLEHHIQLNNSGINIQSAEMVVDNNYFALYYFKIKQINYKLTRINKLEVDPNDIIINNKTTDYSSFKNQFYAVNPKYNQTRLRGTSITLNDLVYEPSISGHRLFMRNNCAMYNTDYRCKLYYRYLNNQTWTETKTGDLDYNIDPSWKYSDTKNLNTLFIMNGPSFTENNLDSDPSIV